MNGGEQDSDPPEGSSSRQPVNISHATAEDLDDDDQEDLSSNNTLLADDPLKGGLRKFP